MTAKGVFLWEQPRPKRCVASVESVYHPWKSLVQFPNSRIEEQFCKHRDGWEERELTRRGRTFSHSTQQTLANNGVHRCEDKLWSRTLQPAGVTVHSPSHLGDWGEVIHGPRSWSHVGSLGRTCIQNKETILRGYGVCAQRKGGDCTRNQRAHPSQECGEWGHGKDTQRDQTP